ncbi:lysase [Sarracenia purpurea var. burkii]
MQLLPWMLRFTIAKSCLRMICVAGVFADCRLGCLAGALVLVLYFSLLPISVVGCCLLRWIWWKNQGLASELKFIRNQLLKWYIWPMATLDDPSLSEHRVELGKVISFIYVIDDIFDVYGSLEELSLSSQKQSIVGKSVQRVLSRSKMVYLRAQAESQRDENQDGYDGSYIEYYMKEHKGSSVESARAQVICMISDAWKRLNRACLSPNPFSSAFTKASMNFARMIPLMYSYDDNHYLPILEEHMKSMLYDNVSE